MFNGETIVVRQPADGGDTATGLEGTLIRQALEAARELTGLDLAYVAEFRGGAQYVRMADGDDGPHGLATGAPLPLEESFCQRMVDGRLPEVIPDTAQDDMARGLPVRDDRRIGAYVGVPVRLPDGELFGSFCCVSPTAEARLSARHADLLQVLARLVGDQIDRVRRDSATHYAQNTFLATVAEDLRAPLVSIEQVGEDLVDRDGRVDPVRAGALISATARRVLARIDDMLLVAQEGTGGHVAATAPVDLVALVRDEIHAVASAARSEGGRITVDVPAMPLVAAVDADGIAQVLRILVDNALRYAPGGGPVDVRLRAAGPIAELSVRDHGVGLGVAAAGGDEEAVPPSDAAAVLGVPAIGLGLATAIAIAAGHEGTLSSAAPEDGGPGATFTLRFPLR